MSILLPPPLNPGDTIGIMAPSGWIDAEDIAAGKKALEEHGYKVHVHPQAISRLKQMAGTAAQKAAAFHDLVNDPAIDAIVCARGGNRSMGMLPLLDYKLIKKKPKILIGFSDATALLNAIHRRSGLVTYHGPVLRKIAERRDLNQMIDLLAGKVGEYDFQEARPLRGGQAKGRLIGGNLSLLQALIGTPYEPDWKNAILFIEDTGDHLSRYDRMLLQMKLHGVFEKISALIVGDIDAVPDEGERAFGYTIEEIIAEHTRDYTFPVLTHLPFGHGERLVTLPVGRKAVLDGTALYLR